MKFHDFPSTLKADCIVTNCRRASDVRLSTRNSLYRQTNKRANGTPPSSATAAGGAHYYVI